MLKVNETSPLDTIRGLRGAKATDNRCRREDPAIVLSSSMSIALFLVVVPIERRMAGWSFQAR